MHVPADAFAIQMQRESEYAKDVAAVGIMSPPMKIIDSEIH